MRYQPKRHKRGWVTAVRDVWQPGAIVAAQTNHPDVIRVFSELDPDSRLFHQSMPWQLLHDAADVLTTAAIPLTTKTELALVLDEIVCLAKPYPHDFDQATKAASALIRMDAFGTAHELIASFTNTKDDPIDARTFVHHKLNGLGLEEVDDFRVVVDAMLSTAQHDRTRVDPAISKFKNFVGSYAGCESERITGVLEHLHDKHKRELGRWSTNGMNRKQLMTMVDLLRIEYTEPGVLRHLLPIFNMNALLALPQEVRLRLDVAAARRTHEVPTTAEDERRKGMRKTRAKWRKDPAVRLGGRLILYPHRADKEGVFDEPAFLESDGHLDTAYAYIAGTDDDALKDVRVAAEALVNDTGEPISEVILAFHGTPLGFVVEKGSVVGPKPMKHYDVVATREIDNVRGYQGDTDGVDYIARVGRVEKRYRTKWDHAYPSNEATLSF